MTHRALRAILRERYGAIGKTARVLRVWREEAERLSQTQRVSEQPSHPHLPTNVLELQERLSSAESQCEQFKARAEVAELREQAHQDRWMLEIDRLREELRTQPNYARDLRNLQSMVMRQAVELAVLRQRLGPGTKVQGEP